MSVPHVTITVVGDSAKAADTTALEESLYMLYVQGISGERRQQWIMFPPALEELGVNAQEVNSSAGALRILHRTQEFEGNRSKWFHVVRDQSWVDSTMAMFQKDGWKLSTPVLVKLEVDDYVKVWHGETSHKAIRAVDREIQSVLKTTTK